MLYIYTTSASSSFSRELPFAMIAVRFANPFDMDNLSLLFSDFLSHLENNPFFGSIVLVTTLVSLVALASFQLSPQNRLRKFVKDMFSIVQNQLFKV